MKSVSQGGGYRGGFIPRGSRTPPPRPANAPPQPQVAPAMQRQMATAQGMRRGGGMPNRGQPSPRRY